MSFPTHHWVHPPSLDIELIKARLRKHDSTPPDPQQWTTINNVDWGYLKTRPDEVNNAIQNLSGDIIWSKLKEELPKIHDERVKEVHNSRSEQADSLGDDVGILARFLKKRFEGFITENHERYRGWNERFEALDPLHAGGARLPLTKIRIIKDWVSYTGERIRPLDQLKLPENTNTMVKASKALIESEIKGVWAICQHHLENPEAEPSRKSVSKKPDQRQYILSEWRDDHG